ncbi:tRNA (guanine37-N1)-methyltransferase [Methanofollis sp. W23]|uniref:class I SAM-dependent methyltransferase n=1 Tax=Methanofollis sp. W23 TaxID=2817849 RepID=UPI001AE1DA93|nr:methyltransferase domain-containing protein [Methanofollis sp. W23]MBP2146945.1 tRNA (guanine37-N1)-methyltransferase [Methanofollis sp. W23]
MEDEERVRRWCLRVEKKRAEDERQALIAGGLLDRSVRPCADGDDLLLPLVEEVEGAEEAEFKPFPHHEVLPRHELVGGIAIMQEEDRAGAAHLLASRPSLHTVLYPTSPVEGEFRTREFLVLAGEETTRTVVTEHGHHFVVDLAGAYFSARLSTERQRVCAEMDEGERVVDMFAGVGPFALTLADHASRVVAADLNPAAVSLLCENIEKNHKTNVIPVYADAAHLPGVFGRTFDRVIMNLPMESVQFLKAAFALCRPGGTIHFYALVDEEGKHLDAIKTFPVAEVRERRVRSYSPAEWHAVYEIVVRE